MNEEDIELLTKIKYLLNATKTSLFYDYSFPMWAIKDRVFDCVAKSADFITNCRLLDAYINLVDKNKTISKIIEKNADNWKSISLGDDIYKPDDSDLYKRFFTFTNVFGESTDKFSIIYCLDDDAKCEDIDFSGKLYFLDDKKESYLKISGNKCFIIDKTEELCFLKIDHNDTVIFDNGYLDLAIVCDENGLYKLYHKSYLNSLGINDVASDDEALAYIYCYQVDLGLKPYVISQLVVLNFDDYAKIYLLLTLAIAYIQRNRIKTHNGLLVTGAILLGLISGTGRAARRYNTLRIINKK